MPLLAERIVKCLNARNVATNVLFFQVFAHGDEQFLSRAWPIDPGETQAHAAVAPSAKGPREPWNGEFAVSFSLISRPHCHLTSL